MSVFQQNSSRENVWPDLIINNIKTYAGVFDSKMRQSRGSSITIYKMSRDVDIGSGILQ